MDKQEIAFLSLLDEILRKAGDGELVFDIDSSFKTDLAGMKQDVYCSPDFVPLEKREIYVVRYFRNEPHEIEVLTPQIHGTFWA